MGELPEEVQEEINSVRNEFREMLVKRQTLVTRVGEALQKVFPDKPHLICGHIKFLLREFIEQEMISEKRIEQLCPSEWKDAQKAEAGAQGAEKTSAKRKLRIRNDGSTDSSSDSGTGGDEMPMSPELVDLKSRVMRIEEAWGILRPAMDTMINVAKIEGDIVTIPKEQWDAFIDAARPVARVNS